VIVAKRALGIRRPTGDLFALALPAGEVVGRIGCYFNGCCFGKECDLPWAIEQHGAFRHPTQIYSAVSALLLFLCMLWLRPRLRNEGDLFKAYLIGFGASRFVIEYFRYQDHLLWGLSAMQWVCIDLVAFASVSWFMRRKHDVPPEVQPA
jgi:phosphatidylglycerol:prolipoprotein diacylglycerol transferase